MVLTKNEIKKRLKPDRSSGLSQLVITPILDIEDQIGVCSVDVRLGKQFVIFKEHITGTFSPNDEDNDILHYQDEIVVPFGESITLHPGKLIIGSTFEFVAIPNDLECQVEGRSSWARLGLIIATATTVEPGYNGIITLELSNTGTIPIKLHPGLKIAQLLFYKTSEPMVMTDEERIRKKYNLAIGPGFSKINKDKYLDYFIK